MYSSSISDLSRRRPCDAAETNVTGRRVDVPHLGGFTVTQVVETLAIRGWYHVVPHWGYVKPFTTTIEQDGGGV